MQRRPTVGRCARNSWQQLSIEYNAIDRPPVELRTRRRRSLASEDPAWVRKK
jgi:hypothetical protein